MKAITATKPPERSCQQAEVNSLMARAFVYSNLWAGGVNSWHGLRLANTALRIMKKSNFHLRGANRLAFIRLIALYGVAQLVLFFIPCLIFSLFMTITGK
jgi:hypothetical protein